MKYDIQIHLKNEKEVFRFIRLLIFTFLFSAVFLGLPDYIWNITWYRVSILMVPWLVAVPAVIDCFGRKISLKKLFGKQICFQIIVGVLLGTILGIASFLIDYSVSAGNVAQIYAENLWQVVLPFVLYIFAVGPSEELVYRVAIMGSLEDLLSKHKWVAPLVANTLFALSHLFQHGWENVIFAFVIGAFYTGIYYKWERCGYVMVAIMHGMFDFVVLIMPYLIAH